MISTNRHYKNALNYSDDPDRFIDELKNYATDPNYIDKLKEVRRSIMNRIETLDLKKKIIPGATILSLLGILLYFFLKRFV